MVNAPENADTTPPRPNAADNGHAAAIMMPILMVVRMNGVRVSLRA